MGRGGDRGPGPTVAAAALVLLAVSLGAVAERAVGAPATDLLLGTEAHSDPRVVVIVYDAHADGLQAGQEEFRRATGYRDIAVHASRSGARAIGFVDFDSERFSDGPGGRANVISSDTDIGMLDSCTPKIEVVFRNTR